jgi:membrane protein
MFSFPKGGLFGRMSALARQLSHYRISIHAANAGYFIILAVFPALVLVVSLLRYTSLDVHDLLGFLEGLIPPALLPEAELLILDTFRTASKATVGLSAFTALWAASRGIYSLLTGLNAVYGLSESRGWLYTRLISVVYTFLFLLVLLLTLVLHVFGTAMVELLSQSQLPFWRFLTGIIDLRFFLLLFLQTALFTAMFMVLPNHRYGFSASIPGALLSSIGWLVFSQLFSLYVEQLSNYGNLYGSVYALAVSMLWLYFCLSILFYGGVLNRYLLSR